MVGQSGTGDPGAFPRGKVPVAVLYRPKPKHPIKHEDPNDQDKKYNDQLFGRVHKGIEKRAPGKGLKKKGGRDDADGEDNDVQAHAGTGSKKGTQREGVDEFGSRVGESAAHGLSWKMLNVGLVSIARVNEIRRDSGIVKLMMPGGIRVEANGADMLLPDSSRDKKEQTIPKQKATRRRRENDDDDHDNEESSADSDMSDGDQDIPLLGSAVKVGGLVLCCVTHIERENDLVTKVQVSLHPDDVNRRDRAAITIDSIENGMLMYGVIQKKEETGYIVFFGHNLTHHVNKADKYFEGFLPFGEIDDDRHAHIQVGTPVCVVVNDEKMTRKKASAETTEKSGRAIIIQLSAKHRTINMAVTKEYPNMSLENLLPGSLVSVSIQSRSRNGSLIVNFLTFFRGVVDWTHQPAEFLERNEEDLQKRKVKARILYVDNISKHVGLSLEPGLVRFLSFAGMDDWTSQVGNVLANTKIIHIDPSAGIGLAIATKSGKKKEDELDTGTDEKSDADEDDHKKKSEGRNQLLYAHISRLHDDPGKPSNFKLGQVVTSRIVAVAHVDGLVHVTLKPSMIHKQVLSLGDLKCGHIYTAKVLGFEDYGCMISVEERVKAVIPMEHLTDVKLRRPQEKFPVGSSVKVRVVSINPEKHRVYAAAKKSYIKMSEDMILSDLEKAAESIGKKFTGSVIGITNTKGARVAFFNNVIGYLPFSELGLSETNSLEDITKLFPVGKAVEARIVSVNIPVKRIILSMRLDKGQILASKAGLSSIQPGAMLSARLKEKATNGFVLEVASEEGKAGNNPILCTLPYSQLSDFKELGEFWKQALEHAVSRQELSGSDDKNLLLSRLVVLQTPRATGSDIPEIIVSMKPSLYDAATSQSLPCSLDDVQETKLYAGYVKSVQANGIIIAFGGRLSGFVRKSRIADSFVSDPSDRVFVGQSVVTRFESFDKSTAKAMLTLRKSDIASVLDADQNLGYVPKAVYPARRLAMYLEELSQLRKHASEFMDASPTLIKVAALLSKVKKVYLGAVIQVKVKSVLANGAVLSIVSKDREELFPQQGITAVATKAHIDDISQLSENEVLPARVLDINLVSGIIDVSLSSILLVGNHDEGMKKRSKKAKRQEADSSASGETIKCVVELVKDNKIILSAPKLGSAICQASTAEINEEIGTLPSSMRDIIQPGTKLQVIVRDVVKTSSSTEVLFVQITDSSLSKLKSKHVSLNPSRKETNIGKINGSEKQIAAESLVAKMPQVLPEFGSAVQCKVKAIRPLEVLVSINKSLHGRLHVTDAIHTYEKDKVKSYMLETHIENPLSSLKEHATFEARVIAHDGTIVNRKSPLEVSRVDPWSQSLSAMKREDIWKSILIKDRVMLGFMRSMGVNGLEVFISLTQDITGRLTEFEASEDLESLNSHSVFKDWQVGKPVLVKLLSVDPLSNRVSLASVIRSFECNTHDILVTRVADVSQKMGVKVSLPQYSGAHTKYGRIRLPCLADDFDSVESLLASFTVGQYIQAAVVRKDAEHGQVDLTTRISWIQASNPRAKEKSKKRRLVEDPLFVVGENTSELTVGTAVRGFVVSAHPKFGLLVEIGVHVTAHVLLNQLADGFVEDVVGTFPLGKLVHGIVTKLDANDQGEREMKVEMSLKSKSLVDLALHPNKKSKVHIAVGDFVRCTIKCIEPYGLFMVLPDGSQGLCHRSELRDHVVKDATESKLGFAKGQPVVVKVLEIDLEKKRISLGMKEQYMANMNADQIKDADMEGNGEKAMDETEDEQLIAISSDSELGDQLKRSGDAGTREESSIDDDDDEPSIPSGSESESTNAASINDELKAEHLDSDGLDLSETQVLKAAEGFDFGEETDQEQDHGDDRVSAHKRQTSRFEKESKAAQERRIREREEMLLNSECLETADDFERVLIGKPDVSLLWIRYLAFHVSLSQIDQARKVAERALSTIRYDRTEDRMNVWLAYINLELMYGIKDMDTATPKKATTKSAASAQEKAGPDISDYASFFSVLDRACKHSNDKHLLLRLLQSLQASGGFVSKSNVESTISEAGVYPDFILEEIVRRLVARHRKKKKMWVALGDVEFRRNNVDAARKYLARALQSLPRYKHIQTILAFAQKEYKFGSHEIGRTMFEGLVGNMPKRLDIWSVYLDMEIRDLRETLRLRTSKSQDGKSNDTGEEVIGSVRMLFDRVVAKKLSSKKMKFFLKKYLEFEKEFGTDDDMDRVKHVAINYVQSAMQ